MQRSHFFRFRFLLITVSLLLCAVLLSACTATPFVPIVERNDPQATDYVVDIAPQVPSGAQHTETATVYFRLNGEELLAPMQVAFSVSVGQSKEAALLAALLAGPVGQHELAAVIPADTQLVSVKEQHGYLEVTLSNAFFNLSNDVPTDWENRPEWYREVMLRRKLAVYSIINTITELGSHSKVLLLIDEDGTGNGQRPSRRLFGFTSSGESEPDTPIEPLSRDASLILSPSKTADIVLSALSQNDVERVSAFLAYPDTATPSTQMLEDMLLSTRTIFSYDLYAYHDPIVSLDGQSAVLCIDYTSMDLGQKATVYTAIPLRLVLQDGIWKVDYDSLLSFLSH